MTKGYMANTLLETLQLTNELDVRRSFYEFYFIFDLDQFYSNGMVHLILSGKRNPKNRSFIILLARCLSIYQNSTRNYSNIDPSALRALLTKREAELGEKITMDRLSRFVTPTMRDVRKAFNEHTTYTNDIYDLLYYDLAEFNRTPNAMTNNLDAFKELQRRLMRAEISDGTKILTKMEIAEKAGIPLSDINSLEGLANVCHDVDHYKKVYQGLVRIQEDYTIMDTVIGE